MAKKLTEEDMIKWCDDNPNATQYVRGYVNTQTKCIFRCPMCGDEFETTPNEVRNRKVIRCKKCRYVAMAESRRLDVGSIIKWCKNNPDAPQYLNGYTDVIRYKN